ncbi:MAG: hydrolase, partial [Ignavibacteriales bacterium]|nr:hydrolase [Ignavibacteriales bacterium]
GWSIENPTFLSSEDFHAIVRLRTEPGKHRSFSFDALAAKSVQIIRKLYSVGLLETPRGVKLTDSIAVRNKNIDILQPRSNFILQNDKALILYKNAVETGIPSAYQKLAANYSTYFVRPNLLFQFVETAEEQKLAEKRVTRYIGIVTENERIVSKHDRITHEIKQKIDSYSVAKGETIGWEGLLLQSFGKFLHIFSLLLLLGIYIFLFRQKVFRDNLKLATFAIIILWICFISYLINLSSMNEAAQFLVFIPAAAMLITIMFDSRLGFYTTVIFSLICGGLQGNNYTFVVMNIVAGVFAVYTVRDIKNRTQIFRSFIFI